MYGKVSLVVCLDTSSHCYCQYTIIMPTFFLHSYSLIKPLLPRYVDNSLKHCCGSADCFCCQDDTLVRVTFFYEFGHLIVLLLFRQTEILHPRNVFLQQLRSMFYWGQCFILLNGYMGKHSLQSFHKQFRYFILFITSITCSCVYFLHASFWLYLSMLLCPPPHSPPQLVQV